MSRLGFKSVLVYHGDACLGELDAVPVTDKQFQFPNNEIRIHHLSPLSERCPPLSILQTISSFSVRCKLESNSPVEQSQLINLHASCFYELKTAVVLLGDEEVHLVAMPSKLKKFPCFWCCSVPAGLYNSSLLMLNTRCLAIVFDLDETLIVANTMKSFEDRIETLTGWIARENDPVRVSGMTSELKRYVEDRALLKQYIESDCVVDGNGKVLNVQLEEVPVKSSAVASFEKVIRPVIRLREKNIVLTRINPEICDTSVLVRLRPAWEDLKSYLIAKGRKRFEVYVCTMAERDYALEMWRLLDPKAHLINSKQLLDHVVCVKSGARKSLHNVFQDGSCHPRMAMVIDDRLKVWEDKDQPRVHVVPAFTPYYAPQAETASAVPVLCVARNVACNVRGGFFKEFDENLLRKIYELFYEDEIINLPPAPDASSYLMSEDASFVPNGNANARTAEGMHGPEVAHRLNQLDDRNIKDSAANPSGPELKAELSQPLVAPLPNIFVPASLKPVVPSEKPSLLGAPFRRDNSFSEVDSDFKRRFPLMNHSQDLRYRASGEPPLLSRLPVPLPVPQMQPQGGWLLEEGNRGRLNNRTPGSLQGSDVLKPDTQQSFHSPISHGPSGLGVQSLVPVVKMEEPYPGYGVQKKSHSPMCQPSGTDAVYQKQSSFNSREQSTDSGKTNLVSPCLYIGVLQDIAQRCCSKVEFRSIVSTSEHLQFSVEVLFTGEKIGVGMGKTRKDAQQQAAENALRCLADKYLSYVTSRTGAASNDFDKHLVGVENGFLWETVIPGSDESSVKDGLPKESTSEAAEVALGNSSNLVNQQVQKRALSPRYSQSNPSKRPKELLHGPQDLPSSRQPKNGHVIA